jgi:hypothetical protein
MLDGDQLRVAIANDSALLETRLRDLASLPHIREALFLASPSLDEALSRWLSSAAKPEAATDKAKPKSKDKDKDNAKVRRTVVKYLYRMTSRSTPFGLFAGCSVGLVGGASAMELPGRDAYTRHTRLDMHYLGGLALALANEPSLREELRYEPNSSLYYCGDQFRYAEARVDGEARAYHLVSVESTDYLGATFERARGGALLAELARGLSDSDPEITFEEAHAYLHELVDAQLLVSELEPSATGPEPTPELVATLRKTRAGKDIAETLAGVAQGIDRLDAAGLGQAPERYLELTESMARLPTTPKLDKLFQVDLFKPTRDLRLGTAEIDELVRGIRLLARVAPQGETPELKEFREKFEARYETREVPLATALDDDIGIGFARSGGEAAAMIRTLPLQRGGQPEAKWNRRDRELLQRVLRMKAEGQRELAITEADAAALESKDKRPYPPMIAVMARVAASSR